MLTRRGSSQSQRSRYSNNNNIIDNNVTNKVKKKRNTTLLLFMRRQKRSALLLVVVFLLLVLVLVLVLNHNNGRTNNDERIAILLPFIPSSQEDHNTSGGGRFPSYLDIFLTSVSGSAELVDFFLICSDIHPDVIRDVRSRLPVNVRLIDYGTAAAGGTEDLAKIILERLVEHKDKDVLVYNHNNMEIREDILEHFARHLWRNPYALVEIKPAMGHIFHHIISEYSHWGYSDLDIMFGDLPRWIDREVEMRQNDIVTYSFGDQDRLYLRGQLTFMKNTDKVNQLWRECDFLSNMDERLLRDMGGQEHLKFESAEGCISAVVLRHTDLKVKYAVKAMTDVAEARNSASKKTVYLGTGSHGDRSVLFKAHYLLGTKDFNVLSNTSMNWFESSDWAYSNKDEPVQRPVGQLIPVDRYIENEEAFCMYWAPKTYQREICVKDVDWYDYNVFLINGNLFKQRFETVDIPHGIETAPFFHFQEWKRTYHESQIASIRDRNTLLTGWALMKEGVIPLPNKTIKNDIRYRHIDESIPRTFPSNFFCLQSSRKKYPPMSFSTTCTHSVSWHDDKVVKILNQWGRLKDDFGSDITLALTLELNSVYSTDEFSKIFNVVEANLKSWQGPVVLLIRVNSVLESYIKDRINENTALFTNTLVAIILSNNDDPVSRKAFTNMAIAGCPTRWVVSGVDIERGSILSNDAYVFAKRSAAVYRSVFGNLFLIPAFASRKILNVNNIGISTSLSDFKVIQKNLSHNVDTYDQLQDECIAEEDKIIDKQLYELWLKVTTMEVTNTPLTSEVLREMDEFSSFIVNDILLGYDKDEWQRVLYHKFAPIMMMDQLGPLPGISTYTVAPEVEEFAGYNCASSLRLGQLAAMGYNVRILSGAFAISDPVSRAASRGTSYTQGDKVDDKSRRTACEYCTMVKDVDLLYYILDEEVRRAIRTALHWSGF